MMKTKEYCFDGMYEPAEAARYIAYSLNKTMPFPVESRKIIRWMQKGLSNPTAKEETGRRLLLSFEDLVSMRIISALRAAGVSFPKIYVAEEWLRKTTGHKSPFATEMLWTEKSDVFVKMKQQLIAASKYGQLALDLLEKHIVPVNGMLFDDTTSIAIEWSPTQGIVFNPKIHFGSPCIAGTRIPTSAIWAMVKGGDDPSFVASSYEIPLDEVTKAFEWEESARRN